MKEIEEMVTSHAQHIVWNAVSYYHKMVNPNEAMEVSLMAYLCGLNKSQVESYTVTGQYLLFNRWVVTNKGKWRNNGKSTWYKYNVYNFDKLVSKLTKDKPWLRTEMMDQMLPKYESRFSEIRSYINKHKDEAINLFKEDEEGYTTYKCPPFKFNE